MIYRLFVMNGKNGEYEKKGDYKTRRMAETKEKPFVDKKRKTKIIPLPSEELGIGFKVYLGSGELYGEIVRDNESFWFIKNALIDKSRDDFFLKDEFENKYINGIFIMKEELI